MSSGVVRSFTSRITRRSGELQRNTRNTEELGQPSDNSEEHAELHDELTRDTRKWSIYKREGGETNQIKSKGDKKEDKSERRNTSTHRNSTKTQSTNTTETTNKNKKQDHNNFTSQLLKANVVEMINK